jgi:hypothetical protein
MSTASSSVRRQAPVEQWRGIAIGDGWSRTHHRSSRDPDHCPARTRCQPTPRPACNHHRKEGERPGGSLPRCCAHRFSGSCWPTVSVHCRFRHGGSMGAARPSCRRTSSVRATILRPHRRQFAQRSEAVGRPAPGDPRRVHSACVRRQPFGNHTFSLPVPLTNRKSLCRKFVPGKRNGEIPT